MKKFDAKINNTNDLIKESEEKSLEMMKAMENKLNMLPNKREFEKNKEIMEDVYNKFK
jgi:restriction endonuclease S subunit